MRVLWVTNTIFPDFAEELGLSKPVLGGWMYGLAKDLVNKSDGSVALTVVSSKPGMNDFSKEINNIQYFLISGKKDTYEYDSQLEQKWHSVIQKVRPHVIHIHGTEHAHGLSLMTALPDLKYVISIQGLISVYTRYFTGQIPTFDILRNFTLKDFLKKSGILQGKRQFKKRGEKIEKKYILKAKNIIGRTQWDYDHVKTINPGVKYHFCNESLRDEFYFSKKWNLNTKNDQTIFLSRCSNPIKGLHQVLKAVSLIIHEYPDLKLRIAGGNIIKSGHFRISGYGKYLRHLIKRFNLEGNIEFAGFLNAEEMVQEYLNAHIFICPSSIENSPNSLGEAQILGVPCISSFVGGVPNMLEHGKDGLLYRFEEVEMLAQSIKRIFDNDNLAQNLSINAIRRASERHDRDKNLSQLLSIYSSIE